MSGGQDSAGETDKGIAGQLPVRLASLFSSLGEPAKARPVDKWHPPHCGMIDMRIAADGIWHYAGSPIGRQALVKLFASILRRDPEGYVLVTPVERVGITVDDVPFLAVEMAVRQEGDARVLIFRTNVDDVVRAGPEHPLRFETDAAGGLRPYVHVRGGLWARLTRALAHDVADHMETRAGAGGEVLGVSSAGAFFAIEATGNEGDGAA